VTSLGAICCAKTCRSVSAPRSNHSAVTLVITSEAPSGPGAQLVVGAEESRAVRVPRGTRGRHGISKAATVPASNNLKEG
jgi:hypothetical protein